MKRRSIRALFIVAVWLISLVLFSAPERALAPNFQQAQALVSPTKVPLAKSKLKKSPSAAAWADSVYLAMSDQERIGQLFMIRAHSNLGEDHIKKVKQQIEQYHVGGLCFFQGTASRQVELTNTYQALSKIPLMIAMDAEWGLGMRFKDDVIHYPRNLMLGAIDDNQLIYRFGRTIARHLKRIGVHINFGPVVDINNNPENPVINDRSFGEDKYNVVTKSYLYMIGLQDEGVMACAKHFPGHGDTRVDSHYDLPIITHDRKRLEEIELFPFQMLSDNGLQSMMVAHVHMPALDSTPNLPTTLSPAVVDTLLKQKIGFDGLIFTDALEMKGVTRHFNAGDIELRAFLAGNDVLLLPNDLEKSFMVLQNALEDNPNMRPRLEESVKKILRAKYEMGLHQLKPVSSLDLARYLNKAEDYLLKEELIAGALTLLDDPLERVPLMNLFDKKVATLRIGSLKEEPVFQEISSFYTSCSHFQLPTQIDESEGQILAQQLSAFDHLIVTLHAPSRLPKNQFGIPSATFKFLDKLREKGNVILCVFGSPYILQYIQPNLGPVIVAYENDPLAEMVGAQAIFGALSMNGRLPVTAGPYYPYLSGQNSALLNRLTFRHPRSLGLDSEALAGIDTVLTEMIKVKAAPGAQVLAIKDGQVFFHKAFGYIDYEKSEKLSLEHMFDLASVTKVAATTLALMRLYELGEIDLDKPISHYLTQLKGSNKSEMTIREVLAHRAGLHPWIPFYRSTLEKNGNKKTVPKGDLYSSTPQPGFVRVAESMYLDTSYWSIMNQEIIDSKFSSEKSYVYSDLGFILFGQLIRQVSGLDVHTFTKRYFYEPMGLQRLGFNPLQEHPANKIVPTEQDQYYRNQLLRGDVHDMAAAMYGGISGHAGLFGSAADLGKLMYMLQNGGEFNGIRYLKKETIEFFTTRYEGDTRRGLGFDMQELNISKGPNVTALASSGTFGHLGFTGTCAWSDPECGIVYVFLSNRVHPSMENNKLINYKHRLRTQYYLYKSWE